MCSSTVCPLRVDGLLAYFPSFKHKNCKLTADDCPLPVLGLTYFRTCLLYVLFPLWSGMGWVALLYAVLTLESVTELPLRVLTLSSAADRGTCSLPCRSTRGGNPQVSGGAGLAASGESVCDACVRQQAWSRVSQDTRCDSDWSVLS